MPNLIPPIITHEMAYEYQQRLMTSFKKYHHKNNRASSVNQDGTEGTSSYVKVPDFKMLLFLDKSMREDQFSTCPDHLKSCVQGIKSYPKGVTTNSQGGVESYEPFYPIFKDLERNGKSLHLHGEVPGVDPMKAESSFLPNFERLATAFPNLKIVLEHVSTSDAVQCVKRLGPNVAATVTPQHASLSSTDVFTSSYLSGTGVERSSFSITSADIKEPHNFCKPVIKSLEDKEAIQRVIFEEGHRRFFFGSDSAPHWANEGKVQDPPSAGCYSSPIAAKIFVLMARDIGDRHVGRDVAMARCKRFLCENGARFFGLELNEETDSSRLDFYLTGLAGDGYPITDKNNGENINMQDGLVIPNLHPLQDHVTIQRTALHPIDNRGVLV